jgi:hypothetical protein
MLLAAIDVLTQHNDVGRTGANLSETVLTTANVNVNTFGRLYSRPVDDQIYAQPLYATNVSIGGGTHDVLYVATVNDTIYAFDANDATATMPYWSKSFINLAAGIRPVFHTDVGQNCGTYNDFSGNIGIVSTPIIDRATNTIYLLARTVENGTFVQRLHALDLSTGAEKMGGPVVIAATAPGIGSGSSGGMVAFNPQTENQRSALAIVNGNVIISWASHCDTGPYHGWVIAYNAANIQQQAWALNVTPNGSNGGIWQSGQGPTIDAAGNIYLTTGNGTVDGTDYGEAILKISPSGQILDYFIPSNYSHLNSVDADLGSAGPLLIPGTTRMVFGGKEGKFYVVDTGNLGQLNATDQVVQEFQLTPTADADHIHGSPVYYQDSTGKQWVYVWGMSDKLKQFQWDPVNGRFLSTTPTFTSTITGAAATPSQPGGMLSISANGQTAGSGIVWTVSTLGPSANQAVQPGIFRAFDATNVGTELWDSQLNAARDDFGNLAKFDYATIDNGRAYLPTFSNQLVVYGLLAGVPAAPASLTATPVVGQNQINLSWPSVSGAVQYSIERKAGAGNFTPLAIVSGATLSYQDATVIGGTTYTYRVRARNSIGDSTPASATATANFIQSLIARWRFDENGGTTAADSSGNGNNGTLGSSVTWTASGKYNSALNFVGDANAYVQVPNSNSLNPGSQISITAWVKATDWAGNRRIVQKGASDNQYRLLVEGGLLKFDLFGIGTASTATLPTTGVFHQITGTYDGSTIRLYVDGVQVASTTASGPLAATTDPLFIATKAVGGTLGNHFNGVLDDVRIYNYALTTGDVSTLATGTVPNAPSNEQLSASSSSIVNVSFNDNSTNESGFIIERKTGAADTYAPVATLPANGTATDSFIDTGLAASTTYFYRVKAFNVIDASAYAPEMSITTPAPIFNTLVAQWKFDETSGTTGFDSTANHNDGTLIAGAAHSTDVPDASPRSIGVNGSTQWLLVPDSNSLEPTSGITLAAWVKASDWSGTRPIISKGVREGGFAIYADNNNLVLDLTNQGTLTFPLPSVNVWHQVAGSYDGSTMKLYIDGVLVAQRAATGALATSSDNLFVGGSPGAELTGVSFQGNIDDARVYNYAVTDRDISAIYGNALWWKLDEGTQSTANDSSPNSNTGALIGSPAWVPGRFGGSAVSFNGATQYIQTVDNQVLNPTTALSLAAWINAADFSGSPRIIEKGDADNQYRLDVESGQLKFALQGVGSITAPLPTTGAWHYVAGTYDGSQLSIYVDGALANSAAATGAIATTTDNLYVGTKAAGTAGTFFHGVIDDVRVYSRGLTAAEVARLGTPSTISGRSIFYNNSVFDSNDPNAAPSDDAAVAPDKQALLPGQTATTANFTNSLAGINGVMIDVAGLADGAALTASDFTFKAGATADPSTWATAPAPAAIVVRRGAGAGGADRIELLWADGTLQNQWLQVTLKADAVTRLAAAPDVFYFGNLVGDANGNGIVSVADTAMTKSLSGQTATITSPADFNRNGLISVADTAIAKSFSGSTLTLFTAPAASPAAAPAGVSVASSTAPASSAAKHHAKRRTASGVAPHVAKLKTWIRRFSHAGSKTSTKTSALIAAAAAAELHAALSPTLPASTPLPAAVPSSTPAPTADLYTCGCYARNV